MTHLYFLPLPEMNFAKLKIFFKDFVFHEFAICDKILCKETSLTHKCMDGSPIIITYWGL